MTRPAVLLSLLITLVVSFTPCRAHTVLVSGEVHLQYQQHHENILVEFLPGPAPAQYRSVLTDGTGHYAVELPSPAGYSIRWSHTGYDPDSLTGIFLYKDTTFSAATLIKHETLLQPGTYSRFSLTRYNSPYRLEDDLHCDSLFIQAGCRLRLHRYAQITVDDYLSATGGEDDSIYFDWIPPTTVNDCYPEWTCPDGPGLTFRGTLGGMNNCHFSGHPAGGFFRNWYPLRFEAQGGQLVLNGCFIPQGANSQGDWMGVEAEGRGTLVIAHSHIEGLSVPDQSVLLTVNDSWISQWGRLLVSNLTNSNVQKAAKGTDFDTLKVRGGCLHNDLRPGYFFELDPGGSMSACSLFTAQAILRGHIQNNFFQVTKYVTVTDVDSILHNVFFSFDPDYGLPQGVISGFNNTYVAGNVFCARGSINFTDSAIVVGNTFDCGCPEPLRMPYPTVVRVRNGADFRQNVVGLVAGDYAYGDGRLRGIVVDSGGTVTNNIVVGREFDSRFGGGQIGLVVGSFGIAVNNLIINCDTGVTATSFATVHYNDSWGNRFLDFTGIPILGVNSQMNANGDSCDAFLNISEDPMVSTVTDGSCGFALASCESPLLDAGDPTYGSSHIWVLDTTCTISGILEEQDGRLPVAFSLLQNYPNPFNGNTRIRFTAPLWGRIKLEIFDVLGRKVRSLADQELGAGSYTADWNALDDCGVRVPSGVYFVRLTTPGFADAKKIVLLR